MTNAKRVVSLSLFATLLTCLAPSLGLADDDDCLELDVSVAGVEADLPVPTAEAIAEANALWERARGVLGIDANGVSLGGSSGIGIGTGGISIGGSGGLSIGADAAANAIPDLEHAFSLSRDPRILGDLGLALRAAGRNQAAWLALFRFKTEARAEYDARRAQIDEAMRALEPELGAVMVTADVEGAEVWIDDRVAARLPMSEPIYLEVGTRPLTVRARGRVEAHLTANVSAGSIARVEAELPEAPSLGLDAPNAEVESSGPGLAFWIVGGVAVAVVIGAIIAAVVHGNLSSDLEAPDLSVDARADLEDDLSFANTMRIGGFVLGGVGLVGALVIFLLADSDEPDCPRGLACRGRNLAVTRPEGFSLSCSPTLGAEGVGAGCGGTF